MSGMTSGPRLRWAIVLVGLSSWGCSSTPTAEVPSSPADAYPEESAAEPKAETPPAAAADGAAESTPAAAAPVADENGETRTLEAIIAFVKERREKVRPCYDAVQKEQPKIKGDLVIHFVLDSKGKVKKAEYDKGQSTIDSDKMGACAVAEMKTWQFPASSRGLESEIDYPFNFNPRR